MYAQIVGLTSVEAKCVVRGISEKGLESDGFLALALLQARYDANTAASLLQCAMEVVNPPTLKNPPRDTQRNYGVGGEGGWAENETR